MLSGPVLFSSYARCGQDRSFAFVDPVDEVVAVAADEVRPALSAVERAVAQGLHAAGFVCYEAAAGLDPAFTTRPTGALPSRHLHRLHGLCIAWAGGVLQRGDSHGRFLKTQKRVQRPEAVEPLRPKGGAVQRYSLRRRMDPPEVRRVMRRPPPLIGALRLFLSSVPCDTRRSVETRPPDVRASTCKPISAARETSTLPPEVPRWQGP